MTRLGFIKPTYPNEKRVCLLPEHAERGFLVESGFGNSLGIDDESYRKLGCIVLSREEVYQESDVVVNLKLTQPSDYPLIKKGLTIIGWTHVNGSGHGFFNTVAKEKELVIFDLINTNPSVFFKESKLSLNLPKNLIWKNNWLAGYASTFHGLTVTGRLMPRKNETNDVAVIGTGNVSQGAFTCLVKLGYFPRMYSRKTLEQFSPKYHKIVVNGVESDSGTLIRLKEQVQNPGVFYIDAAADGNGKTIEGIDYTDFTTPVYERYGNTYYCVNNSPTVFYPQASEAISEAWSSKVYNMDFTSIIEKVRTM